MGEHDISRNSARGNDAGQTRAVGLESVAGLLSRLFAKTDAIEAILNKIEARLEGLATGKELEILERNSDVKLGSLGSSLKDKADSLRFGTNVLLAVIGIQTAGIIACLIVILSR
jgi:hypothetical protein